MSNKGSLYSILYYLAIALIVITIIVVVLIFYNTRKSASKQLQAIAIVILKN